MWKRMVSLFNRKKKEIKRPDIDELYESVAKEVGFRRDCSGKKFKTTENDDNFNISFNKEFGMVDGKYYTEYVGEIKKLKKDKKHINAISLLLKILNAVERESKEFNDGVAPWYYEQLAIIYRKEKRISDEIKVLKRFAAQKKSPGARNKKLAERLIKAKRVNTNGKMYRSFNR